MPALYVGAGAEVIGKHQDYELKHKEEYIKLPHNRVPDDYWFDMNLCGVIDDQKIAIHSRRPCRK